MTEKLISQPGLDQIVEAVVGSSWEEFYLQTHGAARLDLVPLDTVSKVGSDSGESQSPIPRMIEHILFDKNIIEGEFEAGRVPPRTILAPYIYYLLSEKVQKANETVSSDGHNAITDALAIMEANACFVNSSDVEWRDGPNLLDANLYREPGSNNRDGIILLPNLGNVEEGKVFSQGLFYLCYLTMNGEESLPYLFELPGVGSYLYSSLSADSRRHIDTPLDAVKRYMETREDELNKSAELRLQRLYETTEDGLPRSLRTLQDKLSSKPGKVQGIVDIFRQRWQDKTERSVFIRKISDILIHRFCADVTASKFAQRYAEDYPGIPFEKFDFPY